LKDGSYIDRLGFLTDKLGVLSACFDKQKKDIGESNKRDVK
jgi:hypothetical protein